MFCSSSWEYFLHTAYTEWNTRKLLFAFLLYLCLLQNMIVCNVVFAHFMICVL